MPRMSREDLMTLTKARLSFLVIATTLVGYVLASGDGFDWIRLLHTIFGSSLAAFGAGVFNQLMEIDQDAKMRRTSDRPLPAGRIPPALAFGIGWLLAAFGLVHLAMKVNFAACYLTGLTLLDLKKDGPIPLTMSHVAARQEVRDLIKALNLPGVEHAG